MWCLTPERIPERPPAPHPGKGGQGESRTARTGGALSQGGFPVPPQPVQQAVCRPAPDGRIHGRPTVAGTVYAVPRTFGLTAAARSDTSSSLCRRWGRSDPSLHPDQLPGPLRRSRADLSGLDEAG